MPYNDICTLQEIDCRTPLQSDHIFNNTCIMYIKDIKCINYLNTLIT